MTDSPGDDVLAALCRRLDRDPATLKRFPDGSLPVYELGSDLVLKLYPPEDLDELRVEAAALRAVQGRLPIATPDVVDTGATGGWGYLLMGRLPGESLKSVWPRLSPVERSELAGVLGRTLAALHATGGARLEDIPRPDWAEFVARQRATAVERQRANGLDEGWLTQIPSFLDTVDDTKLACAGPVLLHTEVMRDHLVLSRTASGWVPSGLFDFEPAMLGAPEYEFVAVGLFVSAGDARFLRELLLAYGYLPEQLGDELARRLLAYTLLHRYSNLRWYLRELPAPTEPTLDSLAVRWFGTGA
ncbi:hygromycin-B 7''-O-kinase [Amycolatopsis marina]|uniref:Hygromycin-B 7''-O-kinase n=1 Tax=Amycolatopsis marina TaxID=490629 RepID=A0A1I0WVK0_9PSEU|nr:aminoglycoside 3'-phosphotransferase/choline kinase family protein [Amycolatopsis marina]SFA92745.1 hygromycin-B 7''-O-kinase [Amycolatopsis marina]